MDTKVSFSLLLKDNKVLKQAKPGKEKKRKRNKEDSGFQHYLIYQCLP
jgi:hypothetical protein